ncbi:hypothetical protein N8Z33_03245 [Flavobacteriaceae bacterium]|nr:hypothetical protein [Flavobacteriaceae bacterium]
MKHFFLFICLASQVVLAQVGIGTNSPEASSILELSSTTQGFLPPRMTNAQMAAIATPTLGLMVYCTDCEPQGIYYYDGSYFVNTTTQDVSGYLSTLEGNNISYTKLPLVNGTPYTAVDRVTMSIPYTGWSGNTINAKVIRSSNVEGIVATLDPSSINASSGFATFIITGITQAVDPPVEFNINLGSQTASFTVLAPGTPIGPEELILIQQNSSGFENFNASNAVLYNTRQFNGSTNSVFNGNVETGADTFHGDRITAGQDWGMGYTFGDSYFFTQARLLTRPGCCAQRVGGGEFRIYNNGALVATSPVITVTGTSGPNIYTSNFAPNIVGDEVRYIFPNGADTDFNDSTFNFVEFEVFGRVIL